MAQIFKKRCEYCKKKIKKDKEFWGEVKVPEFTGLRKKPFCNRIHFESYKLNVIGTPSRSTCLNCKE